LMRVVDQNPLHEPWRAETIVTRLKRQGIVVGNQCRIVFALHGALDLADDARIHRAPRSRTRRVTQARGATNDAKLPAVEIPQSLLGARQRADVASARFLRLRR